MNHLENLVAGKEATVGSRELAEQLIQLSTTTQDQDCNLVGAGNESPYHSMAGTTRMGVFNKVDDQMTRLRAYITRLFSLSTPLK